MPRDAEPVRGDEPVDDRLDPPADLGGIGDVEQRVEGPDDLVQEAEPDLVKQLLPTGQRSRPRRPDRHRNTGGRDGTRRDGSRRDGGSLLRLGFALQ